MYHRVLLACAVLLVPAVAGPMVSAATGDDQPAAQLILTGMDFPDYAEDIGTLRLPDAEAGVLEQTDPQYLRLSLVDVESVAYLPAGWEIYQTVTTGVEMPVSLNFIVDRNENAWCFNPEIPYCSDFRMLNRWLGQTGSSPEDLAQASSLARFVVEMGISTVHHPRDFLFLRLQQSFGIEHFHYMKSIDEIYMLSKERYRSEEEQEEHATMTSRYRDRISRVTIKEEDDGWRLHGFTYKMMRAEGQLREWDVLIRRDGTVLVKMEILEDGIGEVSFSWAN